MASNNIDNVRTKELLSANDAVRLGYFKSLKAAAAHRMRGTGPKWVQRTPRGNIYYRLADLRAWADHHVVDTGADGGVMGDARVTFLQDHRARMKQKRIHLEERGDYLQALNLAFNKPPLPEELVRAIAEDS